MASLRSPAGAFLVMALFASAVDAQTPAASRMAGEHPDLNGTWDNGSLDFLVPNVGQDGSVAFVPAAGFPPPSAGAKPAVAQTAPAVVVTGPAANAFPKYRPEFTAKVDDLKHRQVLTDPALRCGNPGLPRVGPPDKIVQTAREVIFLYDDLSGSFWRIIPIDGRGHRDDAEESFLGDSVGRWDGDTLVVETDHLSDVSWLTDNGAFHTNGLKVTERLRRIGDRIEYRAVADDPRVLAEPWQLPVRTLKPAETELFEPPPCNEQDVAAMVDVKSYHPNVR